MNAIERDGVSARQPLAQHGFTVYAVIPVFNRLDRTLRCIECLKAQTFQPIKIIVSDGRSTDGTPAAIAERHSDVVVLTSPTVLWWAGSMRVGIDWALSNSVRDDDFVMMVNNDTEFDPGYVESLVWEARARNLAIGGIVVDESDPHNIIDSGVQFDWETYAFIGRRAWPQEPFDPIQPTDVLPGRGTIIPVQAIRRAGNVDDVAFPHYLADYEFTYRLKTRGGVGLAVSFDAVITTELPVQRQKPARHALVESWVLLRDRFSKSSKSNVLVHWRFVSRHAPLEIRPRLRKRLIFGMIRSSVMPAYDWARNTPPVKAALRLFAKANRSGRALYRILLGPYLIHSGDIEELHLSWVELERQQIIMPTSFQDYWQPGVSRSYLRMHHPDALALYQRASNPIRNLAVYADFHALMARTEMELFGKSVFVTQGENGCLFLDPSESSSRQDMPITLRGSRFDWTLVRKLKDQLSMQRRGRKLQRETHLAARNEIIVDTGVFSHLGLPLDELLDKGTIKPATSMPGAYVVLRADLARIKPSGPKTDLQERT